MSLRDQATGSVDCAFTINGRFSIDPKTGSFSELSFADDLCPDGRHHCETIMDFRYVDIGRPDRGHVIGALHGAIGSGGTQQVTPLSFERIGGLPETGDAHTLTRLEAQPRETLFSGEDQG